MTDVADRIRLMEIEERLETATPGPWKACDCGIPQGETSPDYEIWTDCKEREECQVAEMVIGGDAAFISHAPVDIRWLIDRLKKEME